uniref:Uncharacterized protein n=1 Tax=Oryza sativa subsp. japonica TaxID=39947 RepID=Q338V8_ORYSJ|nr:hypothetical protein LOC_Os10g24140 [Oryza sativa Japonica Group]
MRGRRQRPAGFGWRGGEAEDDLAAVMPKVVEVRPTVARARRKGRPTVARARRKGRPKGLARGRMGWRRLAAVFRAKQRSSQRKGRRCDVDGGDGDVGRCSGTAEGAAGGDAVAATPLFTGEDASPMVSP